jgi:hypothetical protein
LKGIRVLYLQINKCISADQRFDIFLTHHVYVTGSTALLTAVSLPSAWTQAHNKLKLTALPNQEHYNNQPVPYIRSCR